MTDNIIENDFDDIIENIFTNNPRDAKSIQLVFDDINDEQLLFNKLVEILVKGMKILFSENNENVNLQDLTDEDFIKLKMYFIWASLNPSKVKILTVIKINKGFKISIG